MSDAATHPARSPDQWDWSVTDEDRELWDRELESFVPPRVFDSHLHLYRRSHFQQTVPGLCASGPVSAGWEEFQRRIAELTPGRDTRGLAFGYPAVGVDFAAANTFVAREATAPGACGQLLVHPGMSAEDVHDQVRAGGFVGLKPYHLFATERPTFEASIRSFLPEHQLRVADELGLTITLHIVRSRALADPENQTVLRDYATRFPRARLILAHAARGFNPHHTILGIESLRGLDSVWFDTSAVTDAGAYEAIIRVMGHERLLYGSDFPVSHLRGRCVAIGDSFHWLSPDNTRLEAAYANLRFSLIGLESLRTLKVACLATGLTDAQVEDVFERNGRRLVGGG